jgi:hypothetical protein
MNEIIKKNGISFGIITGVVASLITATIYSIDLHLFIAIVLLTKTKKELNGVFPFKDAFTTYFISAVIGILISVIFNIILFNFIDPSAKDAIKEITIKYAVEMLQKFNTPASAINEAVKKMQESDQFSIIELLKGSAFSMIFSALFGLLLALVFKSKSTQE